MLIKAFPPHWDYRRVCEILVAGYSSAVGAVFMIHPATLANPVYDRFGGEAAAPLLGLMLMITALLHAFALWLNGDGPKVSRTIRTVACFSHFAIMMFFGFAFALAGAYWGSITMILIMVMVYFALHRAFNP